MAATITPVSHPNQNSWEGEFLGYKAKVIDVTFDASYSTGGYTVTPAKLGWDTIHGAFALGAAQVSDGLTAMPVSFVITPGGSSVRVIPYVNSSTNLAVSPQPASSTDVSTYSVRMVVIGS